MGISGLFSNILSMLALAELGVGSAMTFSLYIPLAQNDIEKIKSLMNFYQKAYRIIGTIVLLLGTILLPVYPYFISVQPDIPHLNLIYILYMLNSGASYFFTYKRALIISDQKKYIESIVSCCRVIIANTVQIIILLASQNFILYLTCQICCTILENVAISHIANRMYPFLREKNVMPLDKQDFKMIRRNAGAMVTHKIGAIVVNSTSSILISRFISLSVAGIYSSYTLIVNNVTGIIGQAFSAITGSVGNLEASEEPDKIYDVFHKLFFLNFFSIGFCTICLLCLFQPFVVLWLGSGYLLPDYVMILIVVDFYIQGMRKLIMTFRDASASYYYDRYKPIVESIINFTLSVLLIKYYGLPGLLYGRIISTLLTCTWVEPFVVYKHVFFEKFRDFIKRYILYAFIMVFDLIVSYFSVQAIFPNTCDETGILQFTSLLIVTVCISVIVMSISTCWMKEFKFLSYTAVNMLRKFAIRFICLSQK